MQLTEDQIALVLDAHEDVDHALNEHTDSPDDYISVCREQLAFAIRLRMSGKCIVGATYNGKSIGQVENYDWAIENLASAERWELGHLLSISELPWAQHADTAVIIISDGPRFLSICGAPEQLKPIERLLVNTEAPASVILSELRNHFLYRHDHIACLERYLMNLPMRNSTGKVGILVLEDAAFSTLRATISNSTCFSSLAGCLIGFTYATIDYAILKMLKIAADALRESEQCLTA